MSEFEVSQELLNIYLEDARGHLEALDHCLLGLERDGFDAQPHLFGTEARYTPSRATAG